MKQCPAYKCLDHNEVHVRVIIYFQIPMWYVIQRNGIALRVKSAWCEQVASVDWPFELRRRAIASCSRPMTVIVVSRAFRDIRPQKRFAVNTATSFAVRVYLLSPLWLDREVNATIISRLFCGRQNDTGLDRKMSHCELYCYRFYSRINSVILLTVCFAV